MVYSEELTRISPCLMTGCWIRMLGAPFQIPDEWYRNSIFLVYIHLLGDSISYKEYNLTRFNHPKKHYSYGIEKDLTKFLRFL